MQSFDDFAADCAAFAEKAAAFRQDHVADLVLGDAGASQSAVLINRLCGLLPDLHTAIVARGHEVNPPAPVDPVNGQPSPEPILP